MKIYVSTEGDYIHRAGARDCFEQDIKELFGLDEKKED